MSIRVIITKNFKHMSDVAAETVKKNIAQTLRKKKEFVLGLATGSSPTGLYKRLARAANTGQIESARIRIVGFAVYEALPCEDVQERVLIRESYCDLMIQAV